MFSISLLPWETAPPIVRPQDVHNPDPQQNPCTEPIFTLDQCTVCPYLYPFLIRPVSHT